MKTAGILIIVLWAVMLGISKSESLKAKRDELEQLLLLCRDIERETRLYRKNLKEILTDENIRKKYKTLTFISLFYKCSDEFNQHDSIEKSFEKTSFHDSKAEKITYSFFISLGNGDVKSELAKISCYEEEIKNLLEKSKSEYEKKGSLYRKLSVLLGAAAAILLI